MCREVKKLTFFGASIAGDYVPLDNLSKVFGEIENKLETTDEDDIFERFQALINDIAGVFLRSILNTKFETSRDFDVAILKTLDAVRIQLEDTLANLRKRSWILLWDITTTRSNEYRLLIGMVEVTDDGWIYLFEGEFNLMYNSDTKTANVTVGIGYKKYISITELYITDYALKYEIARKLFKTPVTGVVEVEVLTN
jgi:hypothetical protein